MKKIIFLLLLLPLFSNAQTDKKEDENKESDGVLTLVHADKTVAVPAAPKEGKKKQKDNTKYLGTVQFKIGNNQITCDSAIIFENDDLLRQRQMRSGRARRVLRRQGRRRSQPGADHRRLCAKVWSAVARRGAGAGGAGFLGLWPRRIRPVRAFVRSERPERPLALLFGRRRRAPARNIAPTSS